MHERGICFTLTVLLLAGTLLTSCTASPPSAPAITLSEAPEDEMAEWELVLFGDSSGWGVADRYAAHIEQDLEVRVKVHDLAASNLSAGSILAALRGESSP